MAAPIPTDLTPFLTDFVWSRVSKKLIVRSGCWGYDGGVSTSGYHVFHLRTKTGRISTSVHRIVYGHLVGFIPTSLQLDHLCRERSCVNPFHCEPIPQKENILRGLSPSAKHAAKTHCPRCGGGYIDAYGQRKCVPCSAAGDQARWARARAKASLKRKLRPKLPPKPRPLKPFCKKGHPLVIGPARKYRYCPPCQEETRAKCVANYKARLAAKKAVAG